MTQLPRPANPYDKAFAGPVESSGESLFTYQLHGETVLCLPGESGAWVSSEATVNVGEMQ